MQKLEPTRDQQSPLLEAGAAQSADSSFELGVTRLFGNGDIGSIGQKSGWAIPESAHSWNDGLEAVFELIVEHVDTACEIEFEGEPFINEMCASQDVVFYVNGFRVGFWRLTEARPYTLSARVEPEQLFRRGGLCLIRCAWFFPNATRPIEKGLSSDTRLLAFCFRSITIGRII